MGECARNLYNWPRCYGCREATDLGPDETVLGFPGQRLAAILVALEALNEKAVPRSRAKQVYKTLMCPKEVDDDGKDAH